MITLISPSRCVKCNRCVSVCPMNVLEPASEAPPAIARQLDCQTCYMCELYCPTDAIYVDPHAEEPLAADEASLVQSGLLGSYRKAVGWAPGQTPTALFDQGFRLLKAHPAPIGAPHR